MEGGRGTTITAQHALCLSSSPVRPSSIRAAAPHRSDPITTRSLVSRQRDQLLRWRAPLRVNCDAGTRRGRSTLGVFPQPLDLWLDNLVRHLLTLRSACRHHESRIESACDGRAGADSAVPAGGSARGLYASGQLQLATIGIVTVIRKLARRRSHWGTDCEQSFRAARACTDHPHRVGCGGWVERLCRIRPTSPAGRYSQ